MYNVCYSSNKIYLSLDFINFCRCLIIFLTTLSTLRIKCHPGWKCGLRINTTGNPMPYFFTYNCPSTHRTYFSLFAQRPFTIFCIIYIPKFFDRSELSELYKPIEDPLIESCMEVLDLPKDGKTHGSIVGSVAKSILAKVFPRPQRCWLPTGCLVRRYSINFTKFLQFFQMLLFTKTTLKYTETSTSSTWCFT